MGKLDNKVAVVTGGGTGIGKATALRFADEGAKVIIVGRRESKLAEVAKENDNISFVAADLTKTEDVSKVIDAVNERYGGQLDILVNNAGWCPVQSINTISLSHDRQAAKNML